MRRDYNCERVCPRADIEQRRSGTLPENKRAGRLFTMCYIEDAHGGDTLDSHDTDRRGP